MSPSTVRMSFLQIQILIDIRNSMVFPLISISIIFLLYFYHISTKYPSVSQGKYPPISISIIFQQYFYRISIKYPPISQSEYPLISNKLRLNQHPIGIIQDHDVIHVTDSEMSFGKAQIDYRVPIIFRV